MATMSMMKNALHMGISDTQRAVRIFLDDFSLPKSRTTRRARNMLMGKLRGPNTMSDIVTMTASNRDQGFETNSWIQCAKRLMRRSTVKTIVNTMFNLSKIC